MKSWMAASQKTASNLASIIRIAYFDRVKVIGGAA